MAWLVVGVAGIRKAQTGRESQCRNQEESCTLCMHLKMVLREIGRPVAGKIENANAIPLGVALRNVCRTRSIYMSAQAQERPRRGARFQPREERSDALGCSAM